MIVNEHYNELRSDYVVKISAGFNSRNGLMSLTPACRQAGSISQALIKGGLVE